MKVIYAGFSKCATKSVAKALRSLGLKVYDFMDHYEHLRSDWMKIYREGATVERLRRMYEGVDAVTGMPVYYYWEELLEAFPEAKVVLYERPVEKWYKSFCHQYEVSGSSEQIRNYFSPTSWEHEEYFETSFASIFGFRPNVSSVFKKTLKNETLLKKAYKMHNDYVKNNCPPEKLLIFDIEQGWAPLCGFLQIEAPSIEFPHSNRKGELIGEYFESHPVWKRVKFEISLVFCSLVFVIHLLLLFSLF